MIHESSAELALGESGTACFREMHSFQKASRSRRFINPEEIELRFLRYIESCLLL